tara:strand:- start:17 stop:400 length:384 start_codon:yes stop_codon:yes gene_type:complete
MKKWLKDISGITAKEKELEEKELVVLDKTDPKAAATRRKKPWVNVLDMQVNQDNIRNGFFELDWNKYFIKELITNGYGTKDDQEEEVVDRWFRDIVYNMLEEEGQSTDRSAGYINVVPIAKGKSEVS